MNTTLSDFMASPRSNEWLYLDHMNVYVRKGKHEYQGRSLNTLDIANISVDPDFQGQGIFTMFLEEAESYGLPVHIENVLTEQFANFFRKRNGYEAFAEMCGMVSFIKE